LIKFLGIFEKVTGFAEICKIDFFIIALAPGKPVPVDAPCQVSSFTPTLVPRGVRGHGDRLSAKKKRRGKGRGISHLKLPRLFRLPDVF